MRAADADPVQVPVPRLVIVCRTRRQRTLLCCSRWVPRLLYAAYVRVWKYICCSAALLQGALQLVIKVGAALTSFRLDDAEAVDTLAGLSANITAGFCKRCFCEQARFFSQCNFCSSCKFWRDQILCPQHQRRTTPGVQVPSPPQLSGAG